MESRGFVIWLKGYLDIEKPKTISEERIKEIREKVNLVFKKEIDPSYSDEPKVQERMQKIHDGNKEKFIAKC